MRGPQHLAMQQYAAVSVTTAGPHKGSSPSRGGGMGPPLQIRSGSFGSVPGPSLQGQKLRFGPGPPLQGDFVRRVVPRPAPTRGRGTSMYRSDEIPLQWRPSRHGAFRFGGHCLRPAGAGIDEATDIHLAKDAVVRGSGASRPWMACARLLEPGTAESGDAPDPRTAAAPAEASETGALHLHCRGSPRSQWTPVLFDLTGPLRSARRFAQCRPGR